MICIQGMKINIQSGTAGGSKIPIVLFFIVVLIFGFLLGDKESKVMKAFEGRGIGCRNDVINIDDL